MTYPLCTICIPAFNAAPFIARTLDCARAQTEPSIAIHVSVDRSDDATADICEVCAKTDPRIKVWRQNERQGWDANANFLISQVETPYYFLYFHDDRITETYVERLCGLLEARPDAASAHADMKHFGETDHVARGALFEGDLFMRLFQFLDGKNQPPLLRSMTRTEAARRIGLSIHGSRGMAIGAHHVYVLGMLACGPALYAPEALYERHNRRSGGLTESWRHLAIDQVRDAFHDNAEAVMRLRVGAGVQAHALLRLVAYLFVMIRIRVVELERDLLDPASANVVSPYFADLSPLVILADVEAGVQERALRAYARLLYLEGNQCERRRDFDAALAKYAASAVADAGQGPAAARIANVRRKASNRNRTFEDVIDAGFASLTLFDRLHILRAAGTEP